MRRYGQMDFDTFDILTDDRELNSPKPIGPYNDSASTPAGVIDLRKGICHSCRLCSYSNSSDIGFLEFMNPLDIPIVAKLDFSTSVCLYTHELADSSNSAQEPLYIFLERHNIHNQRVLLGSWTIEKPLPKDVRGGSIDCTYSDYFSFTICDTIPSNAYVIYKVIASENLHVSHEIIILNPELTAIFSENENH